MTELITPMGYSLYRHLFQVSERYLCYVNGIMFINLCGCFSTFFTRSVMSCAFLQKPSLIDAYRNGIDPEIVQIMKELYCDDYHRFDHKTEKRANSILKNVLIKPIIKDVLRVKCCRWDVEQLTEKLDKNDAEMKAVADQIQKLLDEQPKIVKLSEILSIKVDLLAFFARQKAYLHVPRKAYLQIGEIFEKNGLPSGEKDRLIGARQKSIQRRMNESLILLGKAIKSLNAEATVKVCLLFASHIYIGVGKFAGFAGCLEVDRHAPRPEIDRSLLLFNVVGQVHVGFWLSERRRARRGRSSVCFSLCD